MLADQDITCILISAVSAGNLQKVIELISSYGLSYFQPWLGYVLLLIALKNKHTEVAKLLLTNGSKVNSKNKKSADTPLHFAVTNGDIEIVQMLLDRGANVNAKNQHGITPLHNAVKSKKIVMCLLKFRSTIDSKDEYGRTALHIAVQKGHLKSVKTLLKFGAGINSKDDRGRTALHIAVHKGYLKVVMVLLESHAEIDATDIYGRTPLHSAALKGNQEFVNSLLKFGAKINATDECGSTPLHAAADKGHTEIVEVLLKFDASIDSQDEHGRTALHFACKEGHEQIVIALLEHGSDINIMSKNNRTPLDYAVAGIRSFYNEVHNYDSDDDDFYDHGINISTFEEIVMILKHHMVKKKAANLYVSRKNLQSISFDDELNDFQNECEAEIGSMKSENVGNADVSFYDILTKDTSQLEMCARNESIVQILRSDDYKIKFPIYASMINSYFRKGERRKELLEQAHEAFYSFVPCLPYLCTKKIFSYLSNEDLRNVIDACFNYHVTPAVMLLKLPF